MYRWCIEWITYCICCGVRSVQSSPVNLNLGKSSSWWYNLEGRKGLSTQIPIILTLKSWLSVHWKQSSSIKCTIGEIRWQILNSITNITLSLVNKQLQPCDSKSYTPFLIFSENISWKETSLIRAWRCKKKYAKICHRLFFLFIWEFIWFERPWKLLCWILQCNLRFVLKEITWVKMRPLC